MPDTNARIEIDWLRAQVTSLEQLLQVYERTVCTHATRLEQTPNDLHTVAQALEARVQEHTADLVQTVETLQDEGVKRTQTEQELRQIVTNLRTTTRRLQTVPKDIRS